GARARAGAHTTGEGCGAAGGRVEVVGNPVRSWIMKGDEGKGLKLCGFNRFKPVVLVMGGSQGARQINELVWGNLDELLKKWQIVHITGKGNVKFGLKKPSYKQFDLLFDELKDVYAASSMVVSRGGANSLAEIAALEKKAVIIPLGLAASRGDQIVNARVCAEEYGWQVLYGEVTGEQFLRAIELAFDSEFKGEGRELKKAASRVVDAIVEIGGLGSG
ncbi:MAG: glycosyltransferase, partial [Candidatus Gracilibacteria bacterium]